MIWHKGELVLILSHFDGFTFSCPVAHLEYHDKTSYQEHVKHVGILTQEPEQEHTHEQERSKQS